jgi:hypothetical protein
MDPMLSRTLYFSNVSCTSVARLDRPSVYHVISTELDIQSALMGVGALLVLLVRVKRREPFKPPYSISLREQDSRGRRGARVGLRSLEGPVKWDCR